ncbi:LOW QUALITY PROTEIN: potassium channel regulatory protein [Glossophaga mutica]
MSSQELIILNVGGKKITRFSTIKQFPASRTGTLVRPRFRKIGGQIFVDTYGDLFSFILDFLRTQWHILPTDFSERLREVFFYELDPLVDLLNQEHLFQPRPALAEVHFLSGNTQAFFRVVGSCSKKIDANWRITIFIEHPSALTLCSNPSLLI